MQRKPFCRLLRFKRYTDDAATITALKDDPIVLVVAPLSGHHATLLRDTGATLSPFAAFLLLQGTETLSLRVERHVQNALKVIDYLKTVPEVESISHPSIEGRKDNDLYKKYFPNGGGSIFTFEIKGDAQKAKDFIDNLELFSLLANVADVKSLVIHPATTTHSQCTEEELLDQGIKPNTIRLSIGTENVDDIIEDLDEAFKAVQ